MLRVMILLTSKAIKLKQRSLKEVTYVTLDKNLFIKVCLMC